MENYTPLPEPKIGSFFTRWAAYLIDVYIFAILGAIFLVFPTSFSRVSTQIFGYLYFIYLMLSTKFYSQTIGKHIFGLKVIRENGEQISWVTAIVRELIGKTLSDIIPLGYITALFNKKRKALQDFLAGTIVIQIQPLTKFQITLRFLTIATLPIITMIIIANTLVGFVVDQNKLGIIDSINQKTNLIISLTKPINPKEVVQPQYKSLRDEYVNIVNSQINSYNDQIKLLCRKQYFIRDNCKLNELNIDNLKRIDTLLETSIKNISLWQTQNLK